MIVLDENFPENQRQLLKGWHIRFRQVGYEIGRQGMKDPEIIPLLLRIRRSTFFALDDFYKRAYRHARYCLIYLDVWQYEAAAFVRRLLRHKQFDTDAKRMGTVIRATHTGLWVWHLHAENEKRYGWTD